MSTFLTRQSLPRRTFLRGMGATLSLPLLDAMIPAATAATLTAAKPTRRLGYVFMPMGCDQSRWTPTATDGTLSTLSPILESLAPHRDHLTVLTNMELRNAYPGSHATSNSSFLSAAKAKHTESRVISCELSHRQKHTGFSYIIRHCRPTPHTDDLSSRWVWRREDREGFATCRRDSAIWSRL